MFYRLNRKYMLRGWEKLPYVLVDRLKGYTTFLLPMEMNVLKLCNGRVDFSLPVFDDQIRDIAAKFSEKGVVTECGQNEGLDPVQEYRFYESRYIRSAHWSVTGRCNFRCRHCYMSAPDAKFGEISHEEVISIVDQLADCGIMSVSLTGGECLVRKDFLDIVDRLLEHGILIKTIYSNGALVNEKLLSALVSRGIHPEFNMSFDGVDGWHDWLRGIDGAGKILDRAFRLCRQIDFPTGAEMCLHGKNRKTLRASVNYLSDVGCRSLKVIPVSNVGNGSKTAMALRFLLTNCIRFTWTISRNIMKTICRCRLCWAVFSRRIRELLISMIFQCIIILRNLRNVSCVIMPERSCISPRREGYFPA